MKAVSSAASGSSVSLGGGRDPVVRVVPDPAQEARRVADRAVGPVQRLRRARRVEDRDADGVGPVLGDKLVGVDDVAEVLAHLAAVGDDHLVEQAAGERLAVGHEGERPDVAQRLRHHPLVEDEAAAVVAGDEPLRGQPALQVGVGEHLLRPGLRRDRGRDPEPEGVEVAVEGVGLTPRRGRRSVGQATSTKSGRSASGFPSPVGSTSRGSTTGRSSIGTGTTPQLSQWTTGIGVPQ